MLQFSIIIIDDNKEKYNNNVWLETLLGATLWKFRKFCNFFARVRRKVCVISTLDARLFGGQRTHDFVNTFQDIRRVAAQAGRVHAIFCARGAPKIFRNFAILSRKIGATLA